MKHKTRIVALACVALVAGACGGAARSETTTSVPSGGVASSTTVATTSSSTTSVTTSTTTTSTTSTTLPADTAPPTASGDLAVVQAAMETSAGSVPSRTEGVMKIAGIAGDQGLGDIEMTFSVTTDPISGDTAMTMDLSSMGAAMGEDAPPELADLFGKLEIRQIGDTVFLSFPFFTAFLGAETDWISMPADEESSVTGDMGTGATPSDPTSFLESLSKAGGEVEDLGVEDVHGFSTHHYRVTVDQDWRNQLSAEELSALESQGPLPTGSFPLDVWVDGDGLVHRMSIEMDGNSVATSPDEQFDSLTMTFDFYDFGKEVTIEPPPADQVTDVTDLSGPFGDF
ncbi:MAG: hypothetical protein WB239_01845 [Acidimicrobiia bacterium]